MNYFRIIIISLIVPSVSYSAIDTKNKLDRDKIKEILLKSSQTKKHYVKSKSKKKIIKRKKTKPLKKTTPSIRAEKETPNPNNTRVIKKEKVLDFGTLPKLPPTRISIDRIKKKPKNNHENQINIFQEISGEESNINKYF
ncbi:MAG: Unknown protein [uncultured Sulfurovum sp.]|uniref:Uncharacterized protein n=1 Tax=uncultured Sulfurovum sp. TaxID=269237 RepID=A0A6S6SKX2_9BACT|nr:MAG: Unknown protein [uncultured Sulfurovum sp.]